jgi:hypothetical protein
MSEMGNIHKKALNIAKYYFFIKYLYIHFDKVRHVSFNNVNN